MVFPIYLLALIAVLIILVATVIVYFQAYKRHINKALGATEGKRTPMVPPNRVAIVMTIIVLLISILISYFAGYVNAYKDYEKEAWVMSHSDIQTFYAEVKEVGDKSILVEGISLNDENYRGEFQYDVWGEVSIYRQDAVIQLSDLSEGDLISITLVTDRTGITNIFKIQLLADKK
jgi:heme/copper-type cytochrome/quinol oxidase subunit 2